MPFWLAQWCASPQIWLNNWFLHHGVKMSLDNHTLRCTPHGHATTQCALILGTLKAFTLIRQMVNLSERAVTGLQSMIDNSVNYQVIRRRTFWSTVWFLSISSGMFACVCECLALRLLWLWCHPHPNDFIKQLCLESDVTFYLTLIESTQTSWYCIRGCRTEQQQLYRKMDKKKMHRRQNWWIWSRGHDCKSDMKADFWWPWSGETFQ